MAVKPELVTQVVVGPVGVPVRIRALVLRGPPIPSLAAIAEHDPELALALALGVLGVLARTKAVLPVLLKTAPQVLVFQVLKLAAVLVYGAVAWQVVVLLVTPKAVVIVECKLVVLAVFGALVRTKALVLPALPILSLAVTAELNPEFAPVLALGVLGALARTKAVLPVLLKTVLLPAVRQAPRLVMVLVPGVVV